MEPVETVADRGEVNDDNKTSSSSPSSADFEMLPHTAQPAQPHTDPPAGDTDPHLDLQGGNREDLARTLSDCLQSSPEEEAANAVPAVPAVQSMVNESLHEEEEEEDGPDGENATIFHRIYYLGAEAIEHPKDEAMIQDHMMEINRGRDAVSVRLSVPRTSDGRVSLRRETPEELMFRLPVNRIIYFARGTAESRCFALTSIKLDRDGVAFEPRTFQIHVFRCAVAEAVDKVFVSFAQTFKRASPQPARLLPPENFEEGEPFLFEVSLEIREKEEGKSTYEIVPRQKGFFKLRTDVEKRVVLNVRQISRNHCHLVIERCFGMLVSPGRNVRHADMQLLERVTMTNATLVAPSDGGQSSTSGAANCAGQIITGTWDPSEASFAMLNQETSADRSPVYMTIAADLVIAQVAEPVRFVMETKARIFPTSERYWYFSKKSVVKQFQIRLKRSKEPQGEKIFDLCGIDVSEEIDRVRGGSITSQIASLTASTLGSFRNQYGLVTVDEPISPPCEEDEDSDGEEPLLSGFGEVSKDCSGTELELWSQVLQEWATDNPLQFPKQLPRLVKRGIPEALRGEVWQRMTGASAHVEQTVESYRLLTTQESPDEKVILRDIHRTFPAHEFFKEAGGIGQEALYRIAKAYSIYDSEIGYCQGQSFLIASLLLQMPEEQAFGVLIQVMHRLGLRDMFRENFEQLQLRLYQLDRLIEANFPDLWQHFADNGIESHMYASQWFLTIFTAKFPLFLVFRVLDVFLLFGFDSIFQVALGILKVSKKDMLFQDFEGLMKYFRVNIPKRYRSEENAKHLMEVAKGIKIKRLNKYEGEWLHIKAAERAREDPVIRLERENKKLLNDNLRLDTENDNLARQLVNSKIEMRKEIDNIEDEKDLFEKEASSAKTLLQENAEENKRLHQQVFSLKELLKREVAKSDAELATKANVIADYKLITSQLSEKLEKLLNQAKENTRKSQNSSSTTEICDSSTSSNSSSHNNPVDNDSGNLQDLDQANERVRELELELAQTKLALVETECRLQDVSHHMNALTMSTSSGHPESGSGSHASGSFRSTWFSKTLSSIKETTTHAAASSKDAIRKSNSIDVLKSGGDFQSH
ncbi:hypothetical protein TCAL_04113 [Tigriopus californicus]|uniref:Rab-GAP TBC domain-containing protein n=1 Tax=Tigriopus californicus TaxID=6832 RepID=A0A553NUL0_TIGCA|nr:rab GTPase-activating protein 1-like [Tigriopus californicus]TRY69121.1 hypothetical protein TCAL_04113 [Tigriopus californicus]|eukprot:TCALIF_04113-PA protein Name:"Similar to Rabgap1 Rab GTPase-activating protein 1 (Mus musculus)" AED:0.05 eAED:0.06 QI:0/-1/0/1/-1/1/1/0/1098